MAKVQGVKVTLQPLVDHSVVGYFCMDPNGEYTIRIDGLDLSEPIKINEVRVFDLDFRYSTILLSVY